MRAAHVGLLVGWLVACAEPPCVPGDPTRPHPSARFAVVSSDYSSTAVALLDAEGGRLTESFVDSGTVAPGLVAALSGDVVLPTEPTGRCQLTLVDRLNTDVVSTFDFCVGGVVAQLDVGGAFGANPHDVLALPSGGALVSRYERNERVAADSLERGNDVAHVSLSPPDVRARFDLSPLDRVSDRGPLVLARPSRMVRVERAGHTRVLVGLARLSRDFDVVGEGAIAVIDLMSGVAREWPIPGAASCDTVVPVLGEPSRALVQCSGVIFSTAEMRRDSVAIHLVQLTDAGTLESVADYLPSEHPDAPVYDTAAVSLGGTRVLTVAKGDLLMGTPDRVAVLDLASGTATPLFEAGSAFVVGPGAADGERVLVPDAHLGAVRRFSLPELVEQEPVFTSPCRGLPPREVRRLIGP